jgi:hypothetical protein
MRSYRRMEAAFFIPHKGRNVKLVLPLRLCRHESAARKEQPLLAENIITNLPANF